MSKAGIIERAVPWFAYPAVLVTGLALHLYLQQMGLSLPLSANAAVVLGAVLVTLLEIRFPHIRDWRPQRDDVKQDLLFMVLVQMVLPKLLVLLVVLALVEPVRAMELPLQQWWPHHQPVAIQAVLMVLAADFLRYWVHRVAHRYPPLWRLHAVHHSPSKLYWLNVGRFHPLEKALQFLFDTLPFLVLGVGEPVIALYFVFYAINGFFQHSNIELRYGVLNYLISSAELHRWHHSRLPEESNRNYGNNVIVWDLLFGTWFLPRDRQIADIGLRNRHYPLRFFEQLHTPFTPDITDRDVPLQTIGGWLLRVFFRLRMQFSYLVDVLPLHRAAASPRRTQHQLLMRVLAANRDTRFGREHGFSEIRSHTEFVQRVPVQDYESLRVYIDEQDASGYPALTREQPLMYTHTSGTCGQPKSIPVLPSGLKRFRREQRLFSWVQYHDCPQAFSGKVLCFAGAALEGKRDSGKPYGSVSGYLYKSMPRLVRRNYVIPPEVFEIGDYTLKYKVMLRLALAERNITFLAGANPSSFLRLLELLNECREELIESLAQGGYSDLRKADPALHDVLEDRLRPDVARADELRALAGKEFTYAELWPTLRLLTIWTGGSCGVALGTLRGKLPASIRIVELGYLASECRMTVTIDPQSGAGLPTLQHNFFEFALTREWDAGERNFLTLEQLEAGQAYYVIVTTGAGLYRYFMNDIVRVVGRYRNTPTLVFVRKGKGTTSITGEKLYEDQVLQAVREAEQGTGFSTLFLMMVADEAHNDYHLYLETDDQRTLDSGRLARDLDARLAQHNVEYRTKRESGRLHALKVHRLAAGSGEAYKAHCLARGQREGQFKTVSLQYRKELAFEFDDYRVS